MKRSAEIAAIAAIRRLREERAQAGIMAETSRLALDEGAASAARDAVRGHDREVELRELHLLQALGLDAMGQAELGRLRDAFLAADIVREALQAQVRDTENAIDARRVRIDDLRAAWRVRLRERDRIELALVDARREDARHSDLTEEFEREDSSGIRSC